VPAALPAKEAANAMRSNERRPRIGGARAPLLALGLIVSVPPAHGQESKTGVLKRSEQASPGYTLFAPFETKETYLIDLDGRVVHRWNSEYVPGQSVKLLDDGHLMRAAREPGESPFHGGGEGGRIEEFDWDGRLLWTFVCCDDDRRQHHDFEPLPNGNVLVIAWEAKTPEEAIEAGRDVEAAREGLWPDCVLEIEPVRPEGGKVVWAWRVWDHLIQDRDRDKPNFGVVGDHPELVDLNAGRAAPQAPAETMSEEELDRLRKLGYIGADGEDDDPPAEEGDRPRGRRAGRRGARELRADWNHVNSVAYDAALDQILVSSHNQSEIWLIDHGTTTEEAAAHAGGRRGRGGDLLYRWGNPANWHAGDARAQQLFGQHDARFIESGLRGAGRLLVFNNNTRGGMGFGPNRSEGGSSQLFELELPLRPDGSYAREEGGGFLPKKPLWTYGGGKGEAKFFSPIVSGSQRLKTGGTLITSGAEGYIVEVSEKGEIVWEYRSPFRGDKSKEPRGGDAGPRSPPGGRAGRGEPFGPGGLMAGAFFRAIRIAPDHPAVAGRTLAPIEPASRR